MDEFVLMWWVDRVSAKPYVMSVAVRTWWHKVGEPATPSMRRLGKRFMVGMAIGRHRRPIGTHKELFLVTGTVGGVLVHLQEVSMTTGFALPCVDPIHDASDAAVN